ncbi:MAG: hypothetical protein JW797_19120 [Bradymonadales bacterium]|nr:hypothetical protein [Bradymonadales bacterium]
MVYRSGLTALGTLVLMAVLSQPVLAQSERTDQAIEGDRLVDYGYQFEIRAEGTDWQLLDEEQIRMIVPEAIGGAVTSNGALYLAIVVEQTSNVDLGSAANLLIEAMPLDNRVVELYSSVTHSGFPAIRFVVNGVVSGLHVRYGTILLERSGYLYQLTCFGMADLTQADGSSFLPCWDSVRLLPAERIPGRTGRPTIPETTGVGYRVQQGNYESAANGLSIVPTRPGWRVSIGLELQRGNPEAEVGLAHESPDVYIAFTHEPIAGQNPDEYAQGVQQAIQQNLGVVSPQRSLSVLVDQIPLNLQIYDWVAPALTQQTAVGVFFSGEDAYQVSASWAADQSQAVMALLPEAFSQVHLLSTEAREALLQELALQRDPQNTVGPDFNLRNGLYQDFLYHLTWRKPSPFWKVSTGQDAREYNPIARLVMEEIARGIFGMVIVEEVGAMPNEQYHSAVLQVTLPVGHESLTRPPTVRSTPYGQVLITPADMDVSGMALSYLFATTVVGNRGVQLLLWGYPGNVEAGQAELWAAIDGLTIMQAPLLPAETSPAEYIDRRLGFKVRRPSSSWVVENQTPLEISAVSTMVTAHGDDDTGLIVLAMCAFSEGQDERWFEQVVQSQLLQFYVERVGMVMSAPSDSSLAGQPSRLIRGSRTEPDMQMALHLLAKDHTYYAILAFALAEPLLSVDEMVGLFEFVD